jgi:D-alanyl-D-alanine dipeptidase
MSQARRSRAAAVLGMAALLAQRATAAEWPEGFVDLVEAVPGLQVEARYAGSDNFVGAPIDGYEQARALATREAAAALAAVQSELRGFGLGLRVYDAYRPTRAVAHFMRWAADPQALAMKARFYPQLAKDRLVAEGYIAAHSSHSRGSTVDLTLVGIGPDGALSELDMGTPWDFFGPESWPDSDRVPPQARANRLLLRGLMLRHGFLPYEQEWWHFTLSDEPHPDRAFDFPVR